MEAKPSTAILGEGATHEERQYCNTALVEELVSLFPGSTSRELAEFSGRDRWQVARRLPEAANRKNCRKVHKGRPRECQVTGRMAITWWPRVVPNALAESAA